VPFPGGEALQKLLRHREQEAEPIEKFRPETPALVTAIVRRLMAKEPQDRYQTPAELAAALETHRLHVAETRSNKEPRPSAVPASAPDPFAHMLSGDTAIGSTPFPIRPRSRSWVLVVAAAAGVLASLLALSLLLVALRRNPSPPTPAPPDVDVKPSPPRPARDPTLPRLTIQAHDGAFQQLAFSPDGKTLVSGSRDRTARAWNPATGQARWAVVNKLHEVSALAYSADGRRLAVGQVWRQSAVLLDPATGQVLTEVMHSARIGSVALTADGQLLAIQGQDDQIVLWHGDSAARRSLKPARGGTGLAFSPDGRWLASLSKDEIKLWDVAAGTLTASLAGPFSTPMGFTPDSKQLVVSCRRQEERDLHFLHVSTLACVRTIALAESGGHESWSMARDLQTTAASRADGSVTVWDATTGKKRTTLRGPATAITALRLSADGRLAAAAGADGSIRIWDVSSSQ
jgi:WD40 repeat protein